MTAPDASATSHNPACGDRVHVELRLENGRVIALAHETRACVLTQASAALLAGSAVGRDAAALAVLADSVRAMLKGEEAAQLGYEVFEGVAGHPGRHVCVLLPIEAALKALQARDEP
jgi:NifU-like protein involved in Fe-S cluster formation